MANTGQWLVEAIIGATTTYDQQSLCFRGASTTFGAWVFCLQELILLSLTYIKLFVDYLDAIEPLSDAETGRLFISLMKYAKTGEAPQLSGNERFLFPMMRSQIDRDIQDYESYRKQQSENGKKGGRPPKKRENQKDKSENEKTDGFSENREDNFESEKSKDKEEEKRIKEKDNIPPKSPQGVSMPKYKPEWFERFWKAYPKRKDRIGAIKAWDKLKPDRELCDIMAKAIEKQKKSKQWLGDDQYIPLPSTWLNSQRWEDEVKEEKLSDDIFM